MRIIFLSAIFLLCFSFVFAQNKDEKTKGSDLQFTLSTDKPRYALGETVTVTLTWKNTGKKELKIETSTMMGAVSVFDETEKKVVPYRGMIACGTGGELKIPAGEKFELQNVPNYFLFPNYDLTKPGRYLIKAGLSNESDEEAWKNDGTGNSSALTAIEIFRLDASALEAEREKAAAGNKRAIQILAAHRDESLIFSLAELAKSTDEEMRKFVYRALLVINTDNSLRLLAETAATGKIPGWEKTGILRDLLEMKPLPNPVIIPSLERLLKDDYVGGYTSTVPQAGETPRRYKEYTVRKMAYFILQKLGTEPHPEVILQEEVPLEDKK